jgi:hypothetical protein
MSEPSEHIPFLTQWRLVRSAIEHENTLKSHRVTWFLATQLFLFTGFTSIFVEAIKSDFLFRSLKVYAALVIIFLMGIYVCVLAWANLRAAQKMIKRLQNWWLIHCYDTTKKITNDDRNTTNNDILTNWIFSVKYGTNQENFPPVNGIFTSNMHMIFDEIQLPVALAGLWLVLFFITTIIVLQKRIGLCPLYSLIPPIYMGILLVLGKNKIKNWLKATSPRNSKEFGLIAHKLELIKNPLDPKVRTALDKHPFEEVHDP